MEVINKIKIHFILPGGGVRGSFQAGFIYHLKKLYNNYFDIYRIDGTSVGALNGLALTFEDPEDIRNIWYSIHNIETIFNPWAVKPIWNSLKTLYHGFFQKSLYQNDGLKLIVL
jgi:predicted acylesterase/phospholipase RssA